MNDEIIRYKSYYIHFVLIFLGGDNIYCSALDSRDEFSNTIY